MLPLIWDCFLQFSSSDGRSQQQSLSRSAEKDEVIVSALICVIACMTVMRAFVFHQCGLSSITGFNAIFEFAGSLLCCCFMIFSISKKNLAFVWSPSTLSIIRFTVLLREECHIAMKSRSTSLSHRSSLNILKMLRIQQRPTKM